MFENLEDSSILTGIIGIDRHFLEDLLEQFSEACIHMPLFYRTIILQTTHLSHTGRTCHKCHLSRANFTLLEFWLLYWLMIQRDHFGLFGISMPKLVYFSHSKSIFSLKKKKRKRKKRMYKASSSVFIQIQALIFFLGASQKENIS